MFTEGMKIDIWKIGRQYQFFQILVSDRLLLTVKEVLGQNKYLGTLEGGKEFCYEDGPSWVSEEDGEYLTPAVHVWSHVLKTTTEPVSSLRAILWPEGEIIVPRGDVLKCEEHNLYFYSGESCKTCLARLDFCRD